MTSAGGVLPQPGKVAQLGAMVIGKTQDIGMVANRNGWWLERLINLSGEK